MALKVGGSKPLAYPRIESSLFKELSFFAIESTFCRLIAIFANNQFFKEYVSFNHLPLYCTRNIVSLFNSRGSATINNNIVCLDEGAAGA